MSPAILYSFRRCPYAMRARSAIHASGVQLELREIELRNKPAHMLAHSPKGTVPVLILNDGKVIDQSLDIMLWALAINDPDDWLCASAPELRSCANALIAESDQGFKPQLDRYKYWNRHPEFPMEHYRDEAGGFLQKLEARLAQHSAFLADRITLADMAIAPFIRQFALVDKAWWETSPYPALRTWLDAYMATDAHRQVMKKYPLFAG